MFVIFFLGFLFRNKTKKKEYLLISFIFSILFISSIYKFKIDLDPNLKIASYRIVIYLLLANTIMIFLALYYLKCKFSFLKNKTKLLILLAFILVIPPQSVFEAKDGYAVRIPLYNSKDVSTIKYVLDKYKDSVSFLYSDNSRAYLITNYFLIDNSFKYSREDFNSKKAKEQLIKIHEQTKNDKILILTDTVLYKEACQNIETYSCSFIEINGYALVSLSS
jgi:hypothetical protein